MKSIFVIIAALFSVGFAQQWNSQPGCPKYSGVVFSQTAAHAKKLDSTILKFRATLGGEDNGNVAGKAKGHRSINWDAPIVPFNMPGDFFKNTVTRGAEFRAAKGKFAVSNPSPKDPSGVHDNEFSSFDRRFPSLFQTFSPKRLFTPAKGNKVLVLFSVPKSNKHAFVSGFGAIFTNVAEIGKTFLIFYDEKGCLIIRLEVKAKGKGVSFSGIKVTHKNGRPVNAAIASVKVELGTEIISHPVNVKNVVVLDDLIYGEPLKF